MAANPKRKGMSTLPVYLPKVTATRSKKKGKEDQKQANRIYIEGGFDPAAAKSLAEGLAKIGTFEANIEGEMISSLPRGPQLALRHSIATAARGLATARVRHGKTWDKPGGAVRGEVDQEESTLSARSMTEYSVPVDMTLPEGLAYDGQAVQATLRKLLPDPGKAANIVVTSRALVRKDDSTDAWVPQAVVPGNPVLVGDTEIDAAQLATEVSEAPGS